MNAQSNPYSKISAEKIESSIRTIVSFRTMPKSYHFSKEFKAQLREAETFLKSLDNNEVYFKEIETEVDTYFENEYDEIEAMYDI